VECYGDSTSHINCFVGAMTVGMSTQHDDHLKFLYEGNAEFAVLPTYAVIPAMAASIVSLLSGGIEGFRFDPALVCFLKSGYSDFFLFVVLKSTIKNG